MKAQRYIIGSILLFVTSCATRPAVEVTAGGAGDTQPAVVEDVDPRASRPQSTTGASAVPPVTVTGSPLATRLSTVIDAELGPDWQVVRAIDLAAGESRASLVDVTSNDGQYLIIHLDNVVTPVSKTRAAFGHSKSTIETRPNGDAVVRPADEPGSFLVLVHGDGRRVIVDQSFKHKTSTPASMLERLLTVADSLDRS